MLLKKDETIVFAGDSVTDAGKIPPYGIADSLGQGLGEGYVHFIHDMLAATYPEMNLHIVNSGIGGDTSQTLLERWQKDVLNFKPEWISICIGINDSICKFLYPKRSDFENSYEKYAERLDYMAKSAKDISAGVLMVSPYVAEPWKEDMFRRDMDVYRKICKETAEKYSCKYVDIQDMFDEYFKIRHQCCIAWDRIHPNRIGAYMIAKEILKALEFNNDHIIAK